MNDDELEASAAGDILLKKREFAKVLGSGGGRQLQNDCESFITLSV